MPEINKKFVYGGFAVIILLFLMVFVGASPISDLCKDDGGIPVFLDNKWMCGFFNQMKIIGDDGDGNYTELRVNNDGSLDIRVQDQTTEIIDLHMAILVQPINISINTSIDDKVVTIEAASIPTVNNIVCFKEDSAFYQGEILSVVSLGGNLYNVTLDSPLDYAFTINGGCSERQINLNVDGSVTPIIASISPSRLNVDWDITRILMSMTDADSMDDGKFGGITGGLANGIVFRKVDGITKNLFNAKTNSDLAAHSYDVQYIDSTLGPAGLNALRMRRSFNGPDKNGVTIRLNSDSNDTFEFIIQDDLTGLNSLQLIVQGHVVQG